MQIKVCGLTTTEQVETCIDYGTNFCGFILNYKNSNKIEEDLPFEAKLKIKDL